jgi:hypothetical protein
MALKTNQIFDLGFYGVNTANFRDQPNCSCPCSNLHEKWRKYHNIQLSHEDQISCNGKSGKMITAEKLIQHLKSSTGWYHHAIYVYLEQLHDPNLSVDGSMNHWLFTAGQQRRNITVQLSKDYPVQPIIQLNTSTLFDYANNHLEEATVIDTTTTEPVVEEPIISDTTKIVSTIPAVKEKAMSNASTTVSSITVHVNSINRLTFRIMEPVILDDITDIDKKKASSKTVFDNATSSLKLKHSNTGALETDPEPMQINKSLDSEKETNISNTVASTTNPEPMQIDKTLNSDKEPLSKNKVDLTTVPRKHKVKSIPHRGHTVH